MWTHKKLKIKVKGKLVPKKYAGNYETIVFGGYDKNEKYKVTGKKRQLRLEHRNKKGLTVGKVYPFGNAAAAKKAGWKYKAEK